MGATRLKGKNNTMAPSFVPQCVQFAASQGLTIKEVSMPELEVGKKFLTSIEWGSIVDSILKRWEVASNCSLKNAKLHAVHQWRSGLEASGV